MQKVRVFFAMSAVLLAMGGAFAQYFTPQTTVYELLTSPTRCQVRTAAFECTTFHAEGAPICATTAAPTIQLKEVPTVSLSCGADMWKVIP